MKHIKVLLLSILCLWIGVNTLYAQGTDDGVLSGEFTVSSAGEKVKFSQGNLQCKKVSEGNYEWRFASEQFERLDTLNRHIGKPGAWFDLFGYGSSGATISGRDLDINNAPLPSGWRWLRELVKDYLSGFSYTFSPDAKSLNGGVSTIDDWDDFLVFIVRAAACRYLGYCEGFDRPDYAFFNLGEQFRVVDWGHNAIDRGGNKANVWHSLTSEQWNFIITQRPNANSLRKFITIQTNGHGRVYGLMLLPDDASSALRGLTTPTINETAWKSLETQGAVFLPTAGFRMDSTYYHRAYNRTWDYTGAYKGYYWTATCQNSSSVWYSYATINPHAVHFDEGSPDPIVVDSTFANFYGFSVRLARRIHIPVVFEYDNGWANDTVFVNYGDPMPAAPKGTPTKDEACTAYTFSRWDVDNEDNYKDNQIFDDVTFTAKYTSSTRRYTVTFYNWDSTVISSQSNLSCSATPKAPTKTPARNEDCDSTYEFVGWMPSEFVEAQNCTAYYATFKGTVKKYRVSWLDWNGEELHYDSLENGNAISIPSIPTPERTSQDSVYTFKGWSPDPTDAVVSCHDTVFTAAYDSKPRFYQITWLNDNLDTLEVDSVEYEKLPEFHGVAEKPSTCDHTYTFAQWSPTVDVVTQDTTYTAEYESYTRYFQLTWIDYKGDTLYSDPEMTYGSAVDVYEGEGLDKPASEYSVYFFSGWSPDVPEVMPCDDAAFTAQYTARSRHYQDTIIIPNDSTNEYDTIIIPSEFDSLPDFSDYEKTITHCDSIYEWRGWNPPIVAHDTLPIKYTPVYEVSVNQHNVTWKNWNDTVIKSEDLEYDSLVVAPADPTRTATDDSVYFFKGWSPLPVATVMPCKDIVYTAQYTARSRHYQDTIIVVNDSTDENDTIIVPAEYDSLPDFSEYEKTVTHCDSIYTFAGWNPPIVAHDTLPVKYTAVYTSSVNLHNVTWKDWDGAVLKSENLNYDSLVVAPADPTRTATDDSVYFFKGWSPLPVATVMPCEDVVYTAQYTARSRYYQDTIIVINDSTNESDTIYVPVEYDSLPDFGELEGTVVHCDSTYTFDHWSPDPATTVQDTVPVKFVAAYKAEANTYVVTWTNWNDTTVYAESLEYNAKVNAPLNPKKTADDDVVWFFDGWTPEPALAMPCEDVTYKATFHSRSRHYSDTIILHDDTVVVEVEYDSVPKLDSLTNVVEHCDSTYTFDHWSPQVRKHDTVPMTYVAVYRSEPTMHTVTWKNWDGSIRYTENYELGKTINEPTPDPTRPTDASYVYFFTGWSPEHDTMPCGDVTFKPQFEQRSRFYKDTLVRHNDTIIVDVEYGTKPNINNYKDTVVECDYTYTFNHWEPADTTQDTVAIKFVAVYDSTINSYPVTWYDGDGSVIESTSYEYDALIRRPLVIPTKATDGNVYFFTGWSPEPATNMHCEELVYTPVFDYKQQYYYDTIVRHDDTILISVAYDSVPKIDKYKDTVVHCDSIYEWIAWNPVASKQDTVVAKYIAIYEARVNQHNVTWLNWDATVNYSAKFNFDSVVTYTGSTPTRPTDVSSVYFFTGWSPEPTTMPCADLVFTPQFDVKSRYYQDTILTLNDSTNEYDTTYVTSEYDSVPDLKDYEKTIIHCDSIYTFAGWTPAVGTQDTVPVKYTATYTASVNQHNVTWLNWDATVNYSAKFNFDSVVTYTGSTPTRPTDASSVYFFTGWSPEPTTMPCADLVFTPQFDVKSRYYQDTILTLNDSTNEYDTTYVTVEYDSVPDLKKYEMTIVHCDSIYTFAGWTPAVGAHDTVPVKYTATYTASVNQHNVTWLNWDATVNYSAKFNFDSVVTYTGSTPTRPTDASSVYFFTGWSPEPTTMPCADLVFTPQFDVKSRYYQDTILTLNDSTNEYDTTYVTSEYDSVPDLKKYEMTIVHCDSVYTFAGWTPAVGTQDTVPVKYTATYTASVNQHNVTWLNWDATVNYSAKFNFDSVVTYTGSTPTRPTDASSVYFFTGWSPEPTTMPCEDLVFMPQFDARSRYYQDTVIVLNEETDTYDTVSVTREYGSDPDKGDYEGTKVHCDSIYTFYEWILVGTIYDTVPAKYIATYKSTPNTHNVTWKNWDGTVIKSQALELNAPVVAPADPTRPTDDANVYFFAGWNSEPVATTMPCNDLTYIAQYTAMDRYYTDSVVLKDTTIAVIVDYDSVPDLSGYTQTVVHCDSTYEFLRWSPSVTAQDTQYVEYVAVYRARVNRHNVTWLNWDSTVIKSEAVNYDSIVRVPVTIPTKPSTSDQVYFFTGWYPTPVATMPCNDLTYVADFEAKARYYEDTIIRLDDTVYVSVEYRTIPHLDSLRDTILRCDTLYEWVAWTPETDIQDTFAVSYTAVYRKTPVTHNVTWKDWDGSVLFSEALELNEPINAPANPTRPTDDKFVYFFKGWNPTPATLMPCSDQVYNAQYITKSRYYQDTIVRHDDTVYVTVEYGKTPVLDSLINTVVHCDSIYEFDYWTPAYAAQDTFPVTYSAVYRARPNTHSVTWLNWDGQVIYAEALEFDSLIKQPLVIPTKPTEGGKVYFFSGWNPEPAEYMPCNDVVYVAQFDDKQQYYYDTVVRFRDTILVPVAYDSVPMIDRYKDTITLCDSIYEWFAWTPVPAAQDTVAVKYEAVYSARVNQHSVTWKNWDGSVIWAESLDFDSLIKQPLVIPTRPTEGGKVYFFTGWNPEPAEYMPCNDVEYIAQFSDQQQYYYDTVFRRNDTILVPVAYDSVPKLDVYKDTLVECDSIYEWIGWTPAPTTQDIASVAYTAVYNARVNYHSATWQNWDGQVFLTEAYEYDSVVNVPMIIPTRPTTGGKVYFFSGWSPEPATMECNDMVFTAQFIEKQQYYYDTIVRHDDTVYVPVAYDSVPVLDLYKDTIYTCDSVYEWIGWTPATATQDTTPVKYTAVYASRVSRYDISWLNYDGTPFKLETLDYGASVVLPVGTPVMPSTATETYVFAGWYPTPVATMPCDDLVYTAQFDIIPVYGDVIVHTMTGDYPVTVALGETPDISQYATNVSNCDTLYVFDHWTPAVAPKVPGTVDYTAVYQSFPQVYNVTWKNGIDTVTTTLVGYNMPIQLPRGIDTPTRPATQDSVYTFSGWTMAPGTLMGCGDTVFYATYTAASAYIEDVIVLKDTVIYDTIPYDSLPNLGQYEGTVVHCDYTYIFREWTPAIQPQGADPVVYTALYDSIQNEYFVTWVNGDDTIRIDTAICNEIPSIDDPVMDPTCSRGYIFSGWTPAITPVTGDIVYTATYIDTVRYYQISLFDYDSTFLRTVALQCGETLGDTCVLRQGNDTVNYRFTGWDRSVAPADRDTSYYAAYESEERVIYYDASLSYVRCTGDTLTLPSGAVINVLADGTVNDTVYHAARKPYEGMDCYNNDSLIDMTVYTVTFANYKNPLEGALNISCVDEVVQGMPIDPSDVKDEILTYFVGGYDELIPDWDNSEWQILDNNGVWVTYNGTEIRGHEVGDTVYMRLFIPTNCGDIIFSLNANGCDMSVHQANADNCPDCQNDSVVIAVYDWLLMYEHVKMQSMGYNVTPDKVYWYAIGGADWDDLNDWTIPYALDDEYLGNGYYYTINQAFNGTGDYYALVDVTNAGSRALPCLGIMRSQKFHYATAPASAPKAQLYPSEVRNSDVVYVVGLQSGVKNEVYVYDMTGKLVSHNTVTEDHYEFHAAGAAGTYRVVVITENNKQTLSFIIL